MMYNIGKMLKTVQSAGTLDQIDEGELVLMEETTNLPDDSPFKYFVTQLHEDPCTIPVYEDDVVSMMPKSERVEKQCKETPWKAVSSYEKGAKMQVNIRYDDDCHNGHNTFAITADIKGPRGGWLAGGCLHDEIIKYFPEYAGYIKWHLCSSDGPTHYVANTMYHASDKDCWGGRKGEVRAYKYDLALPQGVDNEPLRLLLADQPHQYLDEEKANEIAERCGLLVVPVPWMYYDGKDPDIGAARNTAIWPEATLSQLQDKNELLLRLPALLRDFRNAMEELGFNY